MQQRKPAFRCCADLFAPSEIPPGLRREEGNREFVARWIAHCFTAGSPRSGAWASARISHQFFLDFLRAFFACLLFFLRLSSSFLDWTEPFLISGIPGGIPGPKDGSSSPDS